MGHDVYSFLGECISTATRTVERDKRSLGGSDWHAQDCSGAGSTVGRERGSGLRVEEAGTRETRDIGGSVQQNDMMEQGMDGCVDVCEARDLLLQPLFRAIPRTRWRRQAQGLCIVAKQRGCHNPSQSAFGGGNVCFANKQVEQLHVVMNNADQLTWVSRGLALSRWSSGTRREGPLTPATSWRRSSWDKPRLNWRAHHGTDRARSILQSHSLGRLARLSPWISSHLKANSKQSKATQRNALGKRLATPKRCISFPCVTHLIDLQAGGCILTTVD